MRPKNTGELCAEHRALDKEIKGHYDETGGLKFGNPDIIQEKKNRKRGILLKIQQRVRQGDETALAYASERGWNIERPVGTKVEVNSIAAQ